MKLFKNAQFISCEDANRVFRIMVADGGRIVFAGDEIPEQYRHVEQIDLKGRCVVPAFGDTHIHFGSFALFHAGLDCRNAENFDDIASEIRRYGETHEREKVWIGFGISPHPLKEKRLPERRDLDRMTSHPVLFIKYDGHAAVANSAFCKGLPASITDDPGFQKDTGNFFQNAFYKVVDRTTRSVSLPKVFRNMVSASDFMARRGIGLVHAAEGVGFPLDLDVDLARLAGCGLPQEFRVFFQTMDLKKVRRRKLPRVGGCFATALDGCFGSTDAAMREPYTHDNANRGTLFYSQAQTNEFVKLASRAGLQVAVHVIGDAAVDQALNAFERALADFPRTDHRHILIHAVLMHPDQIERCAKLGLCVALQTPFLYWPLEPAEYLESILGDRVNRLKPLKDLIRAGIPTASGSDAPCTIPDPIFGIHAACNHPNPDQRISILDALKMHTSQTAYLSFDEKERGTLTLGKKADFVVLDRNPLETATEHLKDIRITDIWFGGERFRETANVMNLARNLLKKRYKNS